MKYDFAGRMTSAAFGTSGGPYSETVTYDGFSQMDQRVGKYWGQDITTDSGIGVNGRMEDGTITYDAAGNLIYYQKTDELHNHNSAIFDAAGRRISASDYFRDSSSVVKKQTDAYVFDGDGHPVIEKLGTAVGTVASPPSDPAAAANAYQVWSTVLGKAVITLYASGYKKEVSVYAGGMQIAVQASGGTGGSDTINWPVSDPVTGTHAYLGGISSAIDEEREPMGQLIALTDPGVPPPPATAPGKGSAGDPEWQCMQEQSRTNGFSGSPLPCFEKYASLEGSQGNISRSSPEEITNPHYGTGKGPKPTLKHSEKLSAGDLERLRAAAANATNKPSSSPDCDITNCAVEINDFEIPGFADASQLNNDLTQVSVADCSNDNAVSAFPFINSRIVEAFDSAMRAVNRGIGNIGFTEMFRPTSRQKDIYDERQKAIKDWENSWKPSALGYNPRPYPAAAAGTSSHEAGFSFDIPKALLNGSRGSQLISILAQNNFVRDVMPGSPLGDIYGADEIHFTHSSWGNMNDNQRAQAISGAQAAWVKLGLPNEPGTAMSAPRAKRPECN